MIVEEARSFRRYSDRVRSSFEDRYDILRARLKTVPTIVVVDVYTPKKIGIFFAVDDLRNSIPVRPRADPTTIVKELLRRIYPRSIGNFFPPKDDLQSCPSPRPMSQSTDR